MEIRTYQQAVNYLEGFIGKIIFSTQKSEDPLRRMRILLKLLGNPQNEFKSVLIGGTAGKGSTAYLLSHILITAGYKTGLTVSPHLQKINERLQINEQSISDKEFTKMVNSMIRIIEAMKKMEMGAPSYFEILITMAFKYFFEKKVDIAVVEVGMGGEFDGTNTLSPLIAVLTNVGLDHTNILGNTVEEIAKTKVGIIKRGPVAGFLPVSVHSKNSHVRAAGIPSTRTTPTFSVISGVRQPSVIKIVEDRCKKVGARLSLLWRDFGYKIKKINHSGSVFDLTIDSDRIRKLNGLHLSLLGQYQAENASIAVKTIFELRRFGFKISDEVIKKALKTSFFPGRFELIKRRTKQNSVVPRNQRRIQRGSAIVLDGAHNPTKMKAFLATLKKLYPKGKKIFVIAFKSDKAISEMLKQITEVADVIIATEFKAKTDMSLHASAQAIRIKDELLKLKYRGKIAVEKNSEKALDKALAIQQPDSKTIIIITGSLYLVGEIRSML